MMGIGTGAQNPHHEAGQTATTRDLEMINNIIAAIEDNPFCNETDDLININTGEIAQQDVKKNLGRIKLIGVEALNKSLNSPASKTSTVHLKTFEMQNKPKKTLKNQAKNQQDDEVRALLRMTQIIASGSTLDIVNFIGEHECSNTPKALFSGGTKMRTGTKSLLVKAIKETTKVKSVDKLPTPQDGSKTAVFVDAMYMIRRQPFKKDTKFEDIAGRYLVGMVNNIPPGTASILFCCDCYKSPSLKLQT